MRAIALELKHELIGLAGVVERNVYLTRRYIYWDIAFFVWTVANTLTIVFIAEGIEASGGDIDVDRATTTLLIGPVVWAYLGIIFEFITETVAWERWEGTIEYTFMAPLSRAMHLGGSGVFAVLYGLVRALHGSEPLGWGLQVLLTILTAVTVCFFWLKKKPFELQAALLAIGALLATPYVYLYDVMVLAVAAAFLVRRALKTGFLPGEQPALLAAAVLIFGFPFVEFPVGFLATAIVGALVLRRIAAENVR